MIPSNQFPSLLRRERERRGWTQQFVADALKAARVTVARWELGLATPALYLRARLCELFEKRLEEFFPPDNPFTAFSPEALTPAGTSRVSPDESFGADQLHKRELDALNGQDEDSPGALIDEDMSRLHAERQHLEIQARRLEMQRRRIEYTIDMANRVINVLDHDCHPAIRSRTIEELLIGLQQTNGEEELSLPTVQQVREALEAARQKKARAKNRQGVRQTSPGRNEVQQEAVLTSGEAILPSDSQATIGHSQRIAPPPTPLDESDTPSVASIAVSEKPIGNPFFSMKAIRDPQEFFGRTEQMQRIYAAIANHQSVALVGPRSIGKTSFLCCISLPEVQARFDFDLSRHVFVYLDLGEYVGKTFDDFFRTITRRIVAQSRGLSGLNLHEEDEGADEFSRLLEQMEDQAFFPILLLDGFENLTLNPHAYELLRFLRAHATMGRISYVTASSAPLFEVLRHDSMGSPFFNIFYTYVLGPLTFEAARELIEKPAMRAGLPFTEEEMALVIKMAGRHPFFIQRVCYYLFEEKLSQSSGQVDEQRLRKLVYEDLRPHFNFTWERLPEAQKVLLQEEAHKSESAERKLPELSESDLFRQFVRQFVRLTGGVEISELAPREVEDALEKLDDAKALGETKLRFLNIVARRQKNASASAVERGLIIRDVLKEAFERMRGSLVRTDTDPALQSYNILYYRYFKYHHKNEQIAARIGFSARQYFRYRSKAIDTLLNILFEMEKASIEGEDAAGPVE